MSSKLASLISSQEHGSRGPFVSDETAYADPMIMTWEITDVDGGTRVDVTADDVPEVISPEDHAAGLNSSLVNLAAYLQR